MSTQASAAVLDLNQLRRTCKSCALYELCLPAGIEGAGLDQLDAVVRDRHSLNRGDTLYRDGQPFTALYVVRAGALKTYVQNAAGDVQVLGFHLPGEIVGFDALATDFHISHAEALERSSICELPFAKLQQVTRDVPALQRQLLRVISREVVSEHKHLATMGKQQAQERLAGFLHSMADRYARLSRNGTLLTLPMSRADIANYLGLVVETVSRGFTRMEAMGVLAVNRRQVRILCPHLLSALCAPSGREAPRQRAQAGSSR